MNFAKKFANQNVPDEIVLSRLPALDFDNPFETINKISSWVFNVSSGDEGYLKKIFLITVLDLIYQIKNLRELKNLFKKFLNFYLTSER